MHILWRFGRAVALSVEMKPSSSHLGDAVEEELDQREEEEAGQKVGVLVGLAMDVGAQEQCGGDDRHQRHLQRGPLMSCRNLTQRGGVL